MQNLEECVAEMTEMNKKLKDENEALKQRISLLEYEVVNENFYSRLSDCRGWGLILRLDKCHQFGFMFAFYESFTQKDQVNFTNTTHASTPQPPPTPPL